MRVEIYPRPEHEFVITLTVNEAASIVWILDRATPEDKKSGRGAIANQLAEMLDRT